MRKFAAMAALLTVVVGVEAQTGDKGKTLQRYGLDQDAKRFPQSNPKEALGSILKAIGDKRFDYLLAHLADPAFVDKRAAQIATNLSPKTSEADKKSQAFNKLVERTAESFDEDPTKLKELQRFLKDGEWDEGEGEAVAKLKGVTARKVFMKKLPPDRWVLQDREK